MNCRSIKNYYSDFWEGLLSSLDKIHFEAHLRACAECLRDYRAFEATGAMLKDLPRLQAPAGFRSRLFARLTASKDGPMEVRSAGPLRRLALTWAYVLPTAAVCSALVMAAALMLTEQKHMTAPVSSSLEAQSLPATPSRPKAAAMAAPSAPKALETAALSPSAPLPQKSVSKTKKDNAAQWHEIQSLVAEINALSKKTPPRPLFLGGDSEHELVFTPVGFESLTPPRDSLHAIPEAQAVGYQKP